MGSQIVNTTASRMLLLTITISLMILPNTGQPMGRNYMEVYPLEGELQRNIFQSTQACRNMEICPLVVNPQVYVPCEVEQICNPERMSELGQSRRGKWKMVKYKKIPWTPCVLKLKPQKYRGNEKWTEGFGHGVVEDRHSNCNNRALHDSGVESSSINEQTSQETTNISDDRPSAMNPSSMNVGRRYTMCVTHICTAPKETEGSTLRSQVPRGNMSDNKASLVGNGWMSRLLLSGLQPNSTARTKIQNDTSSNLTNTVVWDSPGLVTLNYLACLIRSNSINSTIHMKKLGSPSDITLSMKKLDSPSDITLSMKKLDSPSDDTTLNITDGKRSNMNSSIAGNDEMTTLGDGHVVAFDDDMNEYVNDESDYPYGQPTTGDNPEGYTTKPPWKSGGFGDLLTSTERSIREDIKETKVPRHSMNNHRNPGVLIQPQNPINVVESTTGGFQEQMCSDCDQDDSWNGNFYEYLKRRGSDNLSNNITSQQLYFIEPVTPLPQNSGTYSMRSSALTAHCRYPTIPSLNQVYAREMGQLLPWVSTRPVYLPRCSHPYFSESM